MKNNRTTTARLYKDFATIEITRHGNVKREITHFRSTNGPHRSRRYSFNVTGKNYLVFDHKDGFGFCINWGQTHEISTKKAAKILKIAKKIANLEY